MFAYLANTPPHTARHWGLRSIPADGMGDGMESAELIRRAYYDAESRRPYVGDPAIVAAAIPPGGDWDCVAEPGAITRSIVWRGREVATVNPRGDLDDQVEGQIAMAMRALPAMDAALRSIMVLAENANNLALIRELAVSAVAFIEIPAPSCRPEPDEDDELGDDEDPRSPEEIEDDNL